MRHKMCLKIKVRIWVIITVLGRITPLVQNSHLSLILEIRVKFLRRGREDGLSLCQIGEQAHSPTQKLANQFNEMFVIRKRVHSSLSN
jgi:hypothetical protein